MRTQFQFFLILSLVAAILGYRLPESVVPTEYNLEIITNLGDEDDKFEYKGKVTINVTCKSPTDNITLHSREHQILKDKVTVADDGNQLEIKSAEIIEEDDFFVITLSEPLEEDKNYIVEIPFEGILEDTLLGYYKSNYVDKDGKQNWLAVTKFEPIHARRAFPCFDEPAMKAKFTINLGRTKKYTSISNMPIDKTEEMADKPGWEWDRYKQSVLMSTYLVGYAVSDFIHKTSPPTDNNVTMSVWSRKDAEDQIEFAKDIGPKFLTFFEKYFNIPYPLPKQDMIALPDFVSGAMENWGFITYRETKLLFDSNASSVLSKIDVASVVAHELAHQWFGNLVTMKWWTDLWLNEGFATYMSAVAIESIFPEWNFLHQKTADNIAAVFKFDSMQSSHPVSVPVGHPKEISEIFDTISYRKGSYLLHTISNFIGAKVFRKGVSKYLKAHAYGNAEKDDLWKSITKVAHGKGTLPQNLTVKTIMDTWALQTGYPLINVRRTYGHRVMDIEQERFFKDFLVKDTECATWWVPLTFTTRTESNFKDTTAKSWMTPHREIIRIDGAIEPTDWVIFNIGGSGLYRVNYDDDNWYLLIDALKENYQNIPPLDRALLIDNAANLAWIGRITYEIFFDLIEYLVRETEPVPWKTALAAINTLQVRLRNTNVVEIFKEHIRRIITPTYDIIGGFQKLETTNFIDIQHKVKITSAACKYSISKCNDEAVELFRQLKERNSIESADIPNELRGVVYCNGIRSGNKEDWNFLYEMYTISNVATVKNTILKSLGCSHDKDVLNQYLVLAVENTTAIRKQDVATVFHAVISGKTGFEIGKNYFATNIKALHDRLMPTLNKLSSILSTFGSRVSSLDDYNWLLQLTEKNEEYFKEIKNGVKQAIETAKVNKQWHFLHYKMLRDYLKRKNSLRIRSNTC